MLTADYVKLHENDFNSGDKLAHSNQYTSLVEQKYTNMFLMFSVDVVTPTNLFLCCNRNKAQ